MDQLEKDKAQLSADLNHFTQADQEREELCAQLTQLNSELNQLQHSNHDLCKDNESLQEKCAELTNSNSDLQIQMDELKSHQEGEISTQTDNSREKVQLMTEELNKAINARDDLQRQLYQMAEAESTRIADVTSQMEAIAAKNDGLSLENEQLKTDVAQIYAETQDLKSEKTGLTDKLQEVQSELETVRSELSDTSGNLKELVAGKAALETSLQSKETELERLKTELIQARVDVESLENEKKTLLQESITNEVVEQEMEKLMAENSRLTQQVSELSSDRDHLQESLTKELELVRNEVSELQEMNSKYEALQVETEGVRSTSKELEKLVEESKIEIARLREENSLAMEQASALETKAEDLARINGALEEQLKSSNSECVTYQHQAELLADEIKQMKLAYESEMQTLRRDSEADADSLKQRVAELQDENNRLLESASNNEETVDRYEQQIKSLTEQLAQVENQPASHSQDMTHSFEEEIAILKYQIVELKAKLEDAENATPVSTADHDDVRKRTLVPVVRDCSLCL